MKVLELWGGVHRFIHLCLTLVTQTSVDISFTLTPVKKAAGSFNSKKLFIFLGEIFIILLNNDELQIKNLKLY